MVFLVVFVVVVRHVRKNFKNKVEWFHRAVCCCVVLFIYCLFVVCLFVRFCFPPISFPLICRKYGKAEGKSGLLYIPAAWVRRCTARCLLL